MQSKHENFHDPRYSMLLSGINDYVKREKGATKGMNSGHEMVASMSRVLRRHGKKKGIINWLLTKLLGWLMKDRKGLFDDCMEILVEYMMLKRAGNDAEAEKKKEELKFSQCDPGWVNSVLVWIDTYALKKEKAEYVVYKDLDDFAYSIPEKNLKVGVIADWGTGEDEAETVLDLLFAEKPDLVLHLGDVYYSGTEKEYQHNYLDVIVKYREKYGISTPVYNLPGNHDYYSGGDAFYDVLPKTNSAPDYPVQEASYFSLSNSAWQLQGMDTGYNDRHVFDVGQDMTHLRSEEVAWHRHHLDKGLEAEKRILLFSHHQLFSRFINIGRYSHNTELLKHFENYLGKIAGWLWGHEHILEISKPFLGLEKGRCVGYGAVPIIYNEGNPYKATAKYKGKPISPLPEMYPESVLDNNGEVYANGYAILNLNIDKTGTATYYSMFPGDKQAKQVYQEDI